MEDFSLDATFQNRLNFFKISATFSSVLPRVLNASSMLCSLVRFSAISSSIFFTLVSKGLIIVRLSQMAKPMVADTIAEKAATIPIKTFIIWSSRLSIASNRLSISLNIAFCPSSSLVNLSTISLSLILGAVSMAVAKLGIYNAAINPIMVRTLFISTVYHWILVEVNVFGCQEAQEFSEALRQRLGRYVCLMDSGKEEGKITKIVLLQNGEGTALSTPNIKQLKVKKQRRNQ